ncbi:MAG: DUF86 domain-containing protein, partial [Methylococcales bacterium]
GFRNIAVHDYKKLQYVITVNVITQHLDEFLRYSSAILKKEAISQTGDINYCLTQSKHNN